MFEMGFEILQAPFIQNALLAGSLISVAAAIVGYFLIVRGLTFTGHALPNIGFAGAAGLPLLSPLELVLHCWAKRCGSAISPLVSL
jgi:zinc/manganese transport system permease protein